MTHFISILIESQVMRRSVRSLTSATEPVLWHNQNCSKSRAALALLEEHGAPFQVRPYLDDAPTFAELKTLERQLNLAPIEWARTADNAWVEHFDGVTVFDDILPDDDDILRAMAAQPIMIERPILAVGDRACVGRPPERILSLLGGTGDEEEIEGGVAAAPSASSAAVSRHSSSSASAAESRPASAFARLARCADGGTARGPKRGREGEGARRRAPQEPRCVHATRLFADHACQAVFAFRGHAFRRAGRTGICMC